MNKDTKMLFEAYGTIYRGPRTEQDSKDYGMNLAPFMHIIHKLAKGTFDTNSDQDHVAKGELQGIFEVDVVDGHRQVVLTNDAIEAIGAMHPELKDKFWECGKCKADYAGCSAAKQHDADDFREQMPDSKEEYSAHDYAKEMEARGENEESACIEDLAAKHGVSLEEIQQQLEMGLKVEMEHTEDMDIAKKIALDHLAEDPHYYTKLAKTKMESENEERRIDPKCWKGYHKAGTKLKSGVRVNNCVKN